MGQRCSRPARIRGCACTAWHSHTIAQTLYVTEGQGLVQARGQAVSRIRPGDVDNVDGGERHWQPKRRPRCLVTLMSDAMPAPVCAVRAGRGRGPYVRIAGVASGHAVTDVICRWCHPAMAPSAPCLGQ